MIITENSVSDNPHFLVAYDLGQSRNRFSELQVIKTSGMTMKPACDSWVSITTAASLSIGRYMPSLDWQDVAGRPWRAAQPVVLCYGWQNMTIKEGRDVAAILSVLRDSCRNSAMDNGVINNLILMDKPIAQPGALGKAQSKGHGEHSCLRCS